MGKGLCGVVLSAAALFGAVGCGPDYPNCDADGDCHAGEFCVNNLCVTCRDSADCPAGRECRDGACHDIPGYCDAAHHCPGGQVCRANRCAPCTADSECGAGMICTDGACVASPTCDAAHPCPVGEECVAGYCHPLGPQAGPAECAFASIYFDFNHDAIRRDQRTAAQQNRQCMTEHARPVRLTGYCDERGTEEYNMALGQRRADAVRRYLVNLGSPRGSVAGTLSRGKTESRHCYDEGCYQQDRRVDFHD